MEKENKQVSLKEIALVLAKAVHDSSCPASEVIANPWLYKDIMFILKTQMQRTMVVGGDYLGKQCALYSALTNTWMPGPMFTPRMEHRLVFFEGELFMIGGTMKIGDRNCVVTTSAVSLTVPPEGESLTSADWKALPNMRIPHARHGIGLVDGKIFVLGGELEICQSTNVVEIFSINERKWVDGSPMLTPRSNPGVAVIGKKIYVIGGWNRDVGNVSSVEVLDTETNEWKALPPPEVSRNSMGVAVTDNRFIWIFGGYGGYDIDSIEIFDTIKNEWYMSPIKMPSTLSGVEAFAYHHTIFIIGGTTGTGYYHDDVECLDIDEMKWLSPFPLGRRCSTGNVICF
jgi:hypothetical protein